MKTDKRVSIVILPAALATPVQLAEQEQPQQTGKLEHYTITDLGTLGGTVQPSERY